MGPDETRGDYTLAVRDWPRLMNSDPAEHVSCPRACAQLQGLNLAGFCMQLERAVGAKIAEILARDCGEIETASVNSPRRPDEAPAAVGSQANEPETARQSHGDRTNNREVAHPAPFPSPSPLRTRPRGRRCALASKPSPAAPFEPAESRGPLRTRRGPRPRRGGLAPARHPHPAGRRPHQQPSQ
ncbi:hypothetical protein MYCTH_2307194 [Thermothelomyces thermophilus ATCC 42464]|uniref:Uncharacterized protein n=1 Tax=Thermothelomyces thermophilus (strain ATCC 42464 / BCRC 31852 / DSM 1799) TaxID=573729 RepID=G2QFD2_THET4|nr:uncharacterized protein MYCTH_2307194 [Thermothelomyces thermophilus ATCC 42464]AEO59161.1 hypothetical protein MYCTH_2307194 [Thermothelomyces thermophilus ATCC 42464]